MNVVRTGSPAELEPAVRASSSSMATRSSSRARSIPMQRWMPAAERQVVVGRAVEDAPVGLGEVLRVAVRRRPEEHHHLAGLEPPPWSSVSSFAHRGIACTGVSSRRNSSTAAGIRAGLGPQTALDLGLRGDAQDRVADASRGRVVAGRSEQPHELDADLLGDGMTPSVAPRMPLMRSVPGSRGRSARSRTSRR